MSTEEKSAIARLFGLLWAVVVGVYRVVVILTLVVGLAGAWFFFSSSGAPKLESNLALVIYPSGQLVDTYDEDPTQRLIGEFAGELPTQSVLREMIDALDRGAEDSRIALAVLRLDALYGAGFSRMQELAVAVERFRKSGKSVYAFAPFYDQADYLVAAHTDRVSVDPYGMVYLEGFSQFQNYFKEALDKLEIDIHVFRVGEYKSAVEPFERNDMSDEARAANREWLDDLWQAYGRQLAQARKLPDSAAHEYVVNFAEGLTRTGGDGAELAQTRGLIDTIETQQEFREQVAKFVEWDEDHGSFRQVHYLDYLTALDREANGKGAVDKRKVVALVVVQGEIVDGESEPGLAGADTISDMLDQARRDKSVRAVVLRVDSPGGSVFASELIRRGVRDVQAEGIPVVVSMSDVAASGGYWVAMDADEIWALDTTITGSIGIFGLWPSFDRTLKKLGIHSDGEGTTPLAGSLRADRPLSPDLKTVIEMQLQRGYRQFVEGVASGRDIPLEKVEEIARGRVWSGADALGHGLVDQIGGLEQAVAAAVRLAGLERDGYRLEEFRPDDDIPFRRLFDFFGSARTNAMQEWVAPLTAIPPIATVARSLRWMRDPRGIYAHCFCVPSTQARPR